MLSFGQSFTELIKKMSNYSVACVDNGLSSASNLLKEQNPAKLPLLKTQVYKVLKGVRGPDYQAGEKIFGAKNLLCKTLTEGQQIRTEVTTFLTESDNSTIAFLTK